MTDCEFCGYPNVDKMMKQVMDDYIPKSRIEARIKELEEQKIKQRNSMFYSCWDIADLIGELEGLLVDKK